MTDVKDAFKISSDPMCLHKLSFNSSYRWTRAQLGGVDIFTGNMLITRDWPGQGIHSRIIEPYQNSILKIFASQCTVVKASRITPEIGHR